MDVAAWVEVGDGVAIGIVRSLLLLLLLLLLRVVLVVDVVVAGRICRDGYVTMMSLMRRSVSGSGAR